MKDGIFCTGKGKNAMYNTPDVRFGANSDPIFCLVLSRASYVDDLTLDIFIPERGLILSINL